jgi:hypothetical protein
MTGRKDDADVRRPPETNGTQSRMSSGVAAVRGRACLETVSRRVGVELASTRQRWQRVADVDRTRHTASQCLPPSLLPTLRRQSPPSLQRTGPSLSSSCASGLRCALGKGVSRHEADPQSLGSLPRGSYCGRANRLGRSGDLRSRRRAAELTAGRAGPFRWHAIADLARQHPRRYVRRVLADEVRLGRVEGDGNGSVRYVAVSLPVDVVRALDAFGSGE